MEDIVTSQEAISGLMKFIKSNTEMGSMFLESLMKAKNQAKHQMNPILFEKLDWPTTLDAYEKYLGDFARWTPSQSGHEAWNDPVNGQPQEVYYRMCHFYWLVSQQIGSEEKSLQSDELFHQWLITYIRCWGSFLNTTDSFSEKALQSFIEKSPQYHIEDSLIDGKPNSPSGWLTFNQFFARRLNPGLRKVVCPNNNFYISSPADCYFRQNFIIDGDSNVLDLRGQQCRLRVKKILTIGSIRDLIKGSIYADKFAGGTMVHYFLSAYSYHRLHCPVSGTVKESFNINGRIYCDVKITDGVYDIPDEATDGYQFDQTRGILTIDTTGSPYGDVGVVAVIPVGIAEVSSVTMLAVPNSDVHKGDEFGYFMFGASDIIMLFQEKANLEMIDTSEKYIHYGQTIAIASQS